MKTERERVVLLEFGRAGHTEYLEPGESTSSTIQGYETPESYTGKRYHSGAPQSPVAPEGCPVVDVRQAIETTEGYRWVFMGPLLNVRLADGECEACPQPSSLLVTAMAGNEYGTLLAHHTISRRSEKRGSLDHVGIAEFVDGWREHGARIGRLYADGESRRIVWEGGAE